MLQLNIRIAKKREREREKKTKLLAIYTFIRSLLFRSIMLLYLSFISSMCICPSTCSSRNSKFNVQACNIKFVPHVTTVLFSLSLFCARAFLLAFFYLLSYVRSYPIFYCLVRVIYIYIIEERESKKKGTSTN